jgi:transitional endoplasmic reticulum ATPase
MHDTLRLPVMKESAAIAVRARDLAPDSPVDIRHFLAALEDYFPSRDSELLEYMELLAVFESSSRRLLPPKYATMTPEEMDARLRVLRATVSNRR